VSYPVFFYAGVLLYKQKNMYDISKYSDQELAELIENRWRESDTLWQELLKIAEDNLRIYKNNPKWLENLTVKQSKVRDNRIFRNVESLIAGVLANLPKPNVIPGHDTPGSKQLAKDIETIETYQFENEHVRAVLRRALRGLFVTRLFLIKPYWDTAQNNFSVTWVNPKNIRISKLASKEIEADAIIEEVESTYPQMLERFPKKTDVILRLGGYPAGEEGIKKAYLENRACKYKEAWIGDYLICKFENEILWSNPNPYWDWKGLLLSDEEYNKLEQVGGGSARVDILTMARADYEQRQNQMAEAKIAGNEPPYKTYFYNYWDKPRKPYIFGSLFTMENKPFGETSHIEQAAALAERVDEGKRQIAENARWVNGITLVDSTVMEKSEAQKLRYQPEGIIWGNGASVGVKRVTGTPLPEFVIRDIFDNRDEIDNIMGASGAFRGIREGPETKAGRLALIEQSFMQSNELMQVINESCRDLFGWWFQLMRVKYTDYHYTKRLGKEGAATTIQLMRDEIDDGIQIEIIPGKAIPQDAQFRLQRASEAIQMKLISPIDYFEQAGFDNPKQLAKNALVYQMNPAAAVGMSPEEMAQLAPPPQEQPMGNTAATGDIPPEVAQRIKSILESPEFKALPPEEQQQKIAEIKQQLNFNQINL